MPRRVLGTCGFAEPFAKLFFRLSPALIGPSMARHAAEDNFSIERSADLYKGQQIPRCAKFEP